MTCVNAFGRRCLMLPDENRIAYAEAGVGPDVVLLHGALVNADDMVLGPMRSLSERYRVVALDRPGHGLSERPRAGNASLWRQAERLRHSRRKPSLNHFFLAA